MKQAGVGALAAAFEKLKRRLADEGLFDAEHKKPIPSFPSTVAVATSATGAAVRDIIRVVGERFPGTRIVVVPTAVQGRDAVPGIVGAIDLIDEWGEADVAIVGRGGGSLEDLWAFNEEAVARAIFGARTPIVSAVGHEIDTTIADLVADRRAATPSNAGELVVPDRRELARSVASSHSRLMTAIDAILHERVSRTDNCVRAYAFRLPGELVERLTQRTDELSRRLAAAATSKLSAVAAGVERLASELRLADPAHIMARGYAAVSTIPSLAPVRSVDDVSGGTGVRVTVADGSFDCEVQSVAAKPGRES
jgi:exodeoxyribonuclease VII large subunit